MSSPHHFGCEFNSRAIIADIINTSTITTFWINHYTDKEFIELPERAYCSSMTGI